MIDKETGAINWQTIIMSIAGAIVVVMQGYSQIQHAETKADITIVKSQHRELNDALEFTAENLKLVLSDIDERLDILEKKNAN